MFQTSRISVFLLSVLLVGALAGCASHEAAQIPAGMKVGPPLSQAQAQAIQKKYAAKMGN